MAKLKFITSCMNAGKSAHLLQQNHNFTSIGKSVLVFNHAFDLREGNTLENTFIRSRMVKEALQAKALSDEHLTSLDTFLKYVKSYSVLRDCFVFLLRNHEIQLLKKPDLILIDEAQFFSSESIDTLSCIVDKLDLPVYCYGLTTDSNSLLFSGSKRLLEISDDIVFLKSICKCGKPAHLTLRVNVETGQAITLKDNAPQIQVEESFNHAPKIEYIPVCRSCFHLYYTEGKPYPI